ncbi:hypothetical protein ACWDOR_16915 [Streptosporangium canum]
MLRNLFVGAGTLLILAGVVMGFFDPPELFWNTSAGISTPTSFALVELIKPLLLVIAGVGMMLGGLAFATMNRGKDASGEGASAPG